MQTTLQLTIKNVYGNETVYPVNDVAKGIAALTGCKTLTEHALRIAKGMGFALEYVQVVNGQIYKLAPQAPVASTTEVHPAFRSWGR